MIPDLGTMRDHIEDLTIELNELRRDRDRWRNTAHYLARQLGKTEYADTTYQDQP